MRCKAQEVTGYPRAGMLGECNDGRNENWYFYQFCRWTRDKHAESVKLVAKVSGIVPGRPYDISVVSWAQFAAQVSAEPKFTTEGEKGWADTWFWLLCW